MSIYVTYLTVYSGNKLPPFYIGSTSLKKVENGYRGSVSSKKYKSIWKQELKENPQLFKTKIISSHNSRQESLDKEYYMQIKLNVVSSTLYVNMSLARKNGYFGRSVYGEDNPMFGKHFTTEQKSNISYSKKGKDTWNKGKTDLYTTEQKLRMGIHNKNKVNVKDSNGNKFRVSKDDPRYLSGELTSVLTGIKYKHIERTCPHCGVTGSGGNMTRYHFNNCKSYRDE